MKKNKKISCRNWMRLLLYSLCLPLLGAGQIKTLNDSWRWSLFTTASGLPSNRVNDLLETPAGTVWAITHAGLAWYNGYQWIPVQAKNGLPTGSYDFVVPDAKDSLLVGVEAHWYYGGKGGFRSITFLYQGINKRIIAAAPYNNGYLLIAEPTPKSELFLYVNGVMTSFPSTALQGQILYRLYTTRNGIWLKASRGFYKLVNGNWIFKIPTTASSLSIDNIVEDKNGNGIAYKKYSSQGTGVWEWNTNTPPAFNNSLSDLFIQTGDIGPDNTAIIVYENKEIFIRQRGLWSFLQKAPPAMESIIFARFRANGDLWVGAEEGLYLHKASSERWIYWKNPGSVFKNRINEFLKTKDGSLWVAREEGIEIHKPDGKVTEILKINNLTLRSITALAEDKEGNVWIGSGSHPIGAYRWDGRKWKHFGTEEGLGAAYIHKIRKDRQGRLWFLGLGQQNAFTESIAAEPGAFMYSKGQFILWGTKEGLIHGRVYAFAEGTDSSLWFGTLGGLSHWKKGVWKHWTIKDGLHLNRIFTLAVDHHNQLWFSDQNYGVGYIQNDQVHYFTTADGLVSNVVGDIKTDEKGKVWISTRAGLSSYFNGIWSTFDVRSGLENTHIWPILPDRNKVYAGTTTGTAILSIPDMAFAKPKVVIPKPVVSRKLLNLHWQVFPFWGEEAANEIETRYRIDDKPWSGWSTEHTVAITDLATGKHTFQVQAKNLYGYFDEQGETASLEIEPLLIFRPIFYLPVGALLIVIIYLAAANRIKKHRYNKALKKNEYRYRILIENSHELIQKITPEGKFIFTSPAWQKTLGYHPEEIEQLNFFDLIDKEYAEYDTAVIQRAINGESINNLSLVLKAKDGRKIYVEGNISSAEENGKITGSSGFFRDITEKKSAEKILRQSEEKYRDLVNNIQDLICTHDLEGNILSVNPAAIKFLGYAQSEIVGMNLRDIIVPEFRSKFDDYLAKIITNGQAKGLMNIQTSRGEKRIWEYNNTLGKTGNGQFIVRWFARDVTKQKEAEKRLAESENYLRTIVQNEPECVKLLDSDGNLLDMNPAGLNMIEADSLEQVKGKRVLNIVDEHYRQAFKELTKNAFNGAGGKLEFEITGLRGSRRWLETNAVPLKNTEGRIISLLGVTRDITERKKAEIKLNETLLALQTSNKELEQFAYVVSHDLQEPLRMVSSFVNLLDKKLERQLDETAKQYIHFAVDGAARMKTLIQDLLQYSRVGTNKEDFSSTDLNEVLNYITLVLEETIKKNRAVVTVHPLPLVTVNKTPITQLFANLVSNALKFHGGKEPEIEVGYTEEQDNYIFYVKDNGIGIEPKNFERIFIVFQRLHSKNEYPGTGIGLAICKKIAEIHKGKIWVESEPGKGSTFYFTVAKKNS